MCPSRCASNRKPRKPQGLPLHRGDQKHSLPYGCYLSLEPKVPHGDNCQPCASLCNLTEKSAEEDTDTTKEMCQLYCWEDRVRCTTTQDTKTETTGILKIPESWPSEPTSTPPLQWETTGFSKITESRPAEPTSAPPLHWEKRCRRRCRGQLWS